MNKREQRQHQREIEQAKLKRRVMRNWILGFAALVLAFLAKAFSSQIGEFFTKT